MEIGRIHVKQIRLVLILCLCALSLSGTVFAARSTVAAYQSFHQQRVQYEQGNVATLRAWMTLPYIAYTYHVPASYLYRSLNMKETRDTLQTIANRRKRPVKDIIASVQKAILQYRQDHQIFPLSTPSETAMKAGRNLD